MRTAPARPRSARPIALIVAGLVAGGGLLLGLVAAGGATPFGFGRPPRPLPPARTALVTEDGRVSVAPLEGGPAVLVSDVAARLPEEAAPGREEPEARWPSWSPDGTRVAFFRVVFGAGEELALAQLWTVLPDGGEPRKVWEADGQEPIYFAWAPDGRRIALLVGRDGDLDLVLVDASGDEPARRLGRGNPFYFTWSGDGRALLVNVGSAAQSGASKPEIGIIRLGEPGRQPDTYRTLGVTPGPFRTPGWSADGRTVAFVAPGPDGVPALSVASPEGGDVTRLAETPGFAAFALVGDGSRIAWSMRSDRDRSAYEGLEVVSTDGRTRQQVTTALVFAFYWSPNGRELAFAAAEGVGSSGGLAWFVADRDGGNVRRLVGFAPTLEQARLMAFFDQYAMSHGPWAPDSSALVYAVGLEFDRRLLGDPGAGNVLSIRTDGTTPPRPVGRGNLVTLPVPSP